MKTSKKESQRNVVSSLIVFFIIALVPFLPATIFAWGGSAHGWATQQAAHLLSPENHDKISDQIPHSPNVFARITRTPIFPELSYGLSKGWFEGDEPYNVPLVDYTNWEILTWNSIQGDNEDFSLIEWGDTCRPFISPCIKYPSVDDIWLTNTFSHFWNADWFGALGEVWGASKNCAESYPNAWMEAKVSWNLALYFWRAAPGPDDPDQETRAQYLGWAYTYLGHAVHLVEDMTEPAHAHEDLHNETELLENWLQRDECKANLSWFTEHPILNPSQAAVIPEVPEPGHMLYPPDDPWVIINVANAVHYGINICYPPDTDDTLSNDGDMFPDLHPELASNNLPQLFYIMYVLNQIGDYCPSWNIDGNSDEPTGWLGNYAGFPTVAAGGGDFQDSYNLNNNATGGDPEAPNDDDHQLTQLTRVAYKAAFQGAHSVINLFRRTIDNVPPDTTVDMPPPNGLNGWYKSPFTVMLTGATDQGRPGYRPSGVWMVYGLYDGNPPTGIPGWSVYEDGYHLIECLSTDMAGNVDPKDIDFKYDGTPPEITFPDLKPNYLTSESFEVLWNVTDALSLVDESTVEAYLDGQSVNSGDVFDLDEMAGLHTLLVHACDNAGNCIDTPYNFEVWIDARGWCFSVTVNDKTQGNAMSCVVEFPAPYDVRFIDLTTTTLAVKGTIDLSKDDPVIGQTALLSGQLLGGAGDNDRNGIRDRKIQFRKDYFVNALGGQVGNIPSVIRGGLLPSGMPQFISQVTVPVFKSPKK